MKTIIFVLLIGIIASLITALFHLTRKKDNPKQMVKALTMRIAISLALFLIILIGLISGIIQPHGISG